MSRQVSKDSSAESKARVDGIGLTGRYKCHIVRCLRDCGPSYVDPSKEPDDRRKDGWLTQNQVIRWMRAQGLIGDDVQVSSVNPQFAQLKDSGHVIQMDEVPGLKHGHQRKDELTGGWGTLWKIAPAGTMPVLKEKKQFFVVDLDTKASIGPYTKEEATLKWCQATGRAGIFKVSGSVRYKLEAVS